LESSYKSRIDTTFPSFTEEIKSNSQLLTEPIRSQYLGRVFESLEVHLLKLPSTEEVKGKYPFSEPVGLEEVKNFDEELGVESFTEVLSPDSTNFGFFLCFEICRDALKEITYKMGQLFKKELDSYYQNSMAGMNTDSIQFNLTVPELSYFFGLMKRITLLNSTREEIASTLSKSVLVSTGDRPSVKSILTKLGSASGPPTSSQVQAAHINQVKRTLERLLNQLNQDISGQSGGNVTPSV
jgi:hypothetical protein